MSCTFRFMVTLVLLVVSLALRPGITHADGGEVTFGPGWNMAGGPVGTDLSAAEALYTYGAAGYVVPSSSLANGCQGEWAYFSRPTVVSLPNVSAAASTFDCSLRTGWNMVGNPFSAPAALPAGVTAFHWNPDAARYDTTSVLPTGGAVWIDAVSATVITLRSMQPPPGVPPPSGTLVIAPPFAAAYQAHVGDDVTLMVPGTMAFTATADPAYLRLEVSGATQSYPETYFWRWRAIAAGTTTIVLDPACRSSVPPCAAPSLVVRLEVVP